MTAPAPRGVREMPATGGIYTASKTRHAFMWQGVRGLYPIISTWLDEAGPGETGDWGDLWTRCIAEASGCAALVLFAVDEAEASELKGALVEVGAALAHGRPVFYCGPDMPRWSFLRHPLVTRCASPAEALALAAAEARQP